MSEGVVVAARIGAGAPRSRAPGRARPSATAARSFRMPEVVVGVLLVAGCALGALVWQRHASATTTVVVAARRIARGHAIEPDDLRGAQLGGETTGLIASADAVAVPGQIALVEIEPGEPLSHSMLSDEPALASAEALTPIALRDGDLPPDLAVHDRVRVLVTGSVDASGAAATTLLDDVASVWSVDSSADRVSIVVTLRGSLDLAQSVTSAVHVRLVRVGG